MYNEIELIYYSDTFLGYVIDHEIAVYGDEVEVSMCWFTKKEKKNHIKRSIVLCETSYLKGHTLFDIIKILENRKIKDLFILTLLKRNNEGMDFPDRTPDINYELDLLL